MITTMYSHLKPHFVFNSLTAIGSLCSGNSEAQEALTAFSDYLRVNISYHNQKTPVLFDTELKHVENYLFLEKLRFEERLIVLYDIKVTGFKVPVLSVQPIVENAVSHGLFHKPGVGTVRIRTVESETEYIISVVDDGVGYDTSTSGDSALRDNTSGDNTSEDNTSGENVERENGKSHKGIENVKNRLASMCGGTLTVYSKPGVGTRVNIKIPKGSGS